MATVIAKTAAGLDAAVLRAQKTANRTGKEVEVHYYRPKTEGTGRGRYKAYYTTVWPERSNPVPKIGKWIKAHAVRIVKRNGVKHLEIKR